MKQDISSFGTERVRLRLLEPRDADLILKWRNDDDVRRWFKTSSILQLDSHLAWLEQYWTRDNDFIFIVETDGKPIGQVSVYDVDCCKKTAEVGRFIVAPEARGKGYMREACTALLDFCKNQFGSRAIYLEVLEHNSRARGLYERLGFSPNNTTQDGLLHMYLKLAS